MAIGINFILFDGARLKQQMGIVRALNPDHLSLYKGRQEIDLADVGPYLSGFEPGDKFAYWYKETGWGNSWGFLVNSTSNMEGLLQHFQKFLLIKNENGKELYFRFYDPRVLRTFLPTCDEQQLIEFFGPVQQFICEDEDPLFALIFSFNGKRLVIERVVHSVVFPSITKTENAVSPNVNTATAIGNNAVAVELKAQRPARKFFD